MGAHSWFCRLGGDALFRRLNRARIPVLMYHGVLPDGSAFAEGSWLQVRSSEFEAQVAFLSRHYQILSVSQALSGDFRREALPPVVITFDDGYANNVHHALPILEKYRAPACIFVTTGYLGTAHIFWWDRLHLAFPEGGHGGADIAWLKSLPAERIELEVDQLIAAAGRQVPQAALEEFRCMNNEELQLASKSGLLEFGSHTHWHQIIEPMDAQAVSETLRCSRQALANLHVEAPCFAAPNGDYTQAQIELIKAAGFSACFATHEALWSPGTDHPYRIPRLGIGRGAQLPWFINHLAGAIVALRSLKSGKPRLLTY